MIVFISKQNREIMNYYKILNKRMFKIKLFENLADFESEEIFVDKIACLIIDITDVSIQQKINYIVKIMSDYSKRTKILIISNEDLFASDYFLMSQHFVKIANRELDIFDFKAIFKSYHRYFYKF